MTGDRGNNDATETEPDYQQFGHPVEPLSHWRHEESQGAGLLVVVAAPRPSQARPPESTSSVVTALISSAGARKVAAVTAVHSRMGEVLAAKKPSVVYASSIGWSGLLVGSACHR